MARRKARSLDLLERSIEEALQPGDFVGWRDSFSFASDLDDVAKQIERLLLSEPDRALSLYETFLAGAYEKADEVDDSDGSFGTFVESLFCGWIRARQE